MPVPTTLCLCAPIKVARRPGTEEAKDATEFLGFIDEERLLTIAMATDAADSAFALTRILDTESSGLSCLGSILEDSVDFPLTDESRQIMTLPKLGLAPAPVERS